MIEVPWLFWRPCFNNMFPILYFKVKNILRGLSLRGFFLSNYAFDCRNCLNMSTDRYVSIFVFIIIQENKKYITNENNPYKIPWTLHFKMGIKILVLTLPPHIAILWFNTIEINSRKKLNCFNFLWS